ncbi:Prolow-density lipoprotein receptor-related protein 1 [Thelohanellus kitauei]|uniref:Prolow-density lipoprotein receptor-related protein 1 n=1 Tax=Thelohanellus kitauei TaxID=669202 RepID=A0A0C2MM66_THEKT|nr:Prolow-density lipoprotein receptor-related protein 1 [Thelohanellus kitauei]
MFIILRRNPIKFDQISHQFFQIGEQYYIVATDQKGEKCLFTSYSNGYLTRILCHLDPKDSEEECSVLTHPSLPGIIFMNGPGSDGHIVTFISFDDGKKIFPIKIDEQITECRENSCRIKLKLPCFYEYVDNSRAGFFLKFEGILYNNNQVTYHNFVSFNGGITWKILDMDLKNTYILNNGGMIIGIQPLTKFICSDLDCIDGRKPLNIFNGFSKLDPGSCSIQKSSDNANSEYADYCISDEYTNHIFILFSHTLHESQLDYSGHFLPYTQFVIKMLPHTTGFPCPIVYDMNYNGMFLYDNHTVFGFKGTKGYFREEKIEIYRFKRDIVSMMFDHFMSLLFLLDTHQELSVVLLETNYIKLLARNVTFFRYHPKNLAISYATSDQICYYRLYSGKSCLNMEMNLKKYVYMEETGYHALLLQNSTLFIVDDSNLRQSYLNQILYTLDEVDFFDFINQHVYMIQKTMLIHLDLKQPFRLNLVSHKSFANAVELNTFTHYMSKMTHKINDTECMFICNTLIKSDDFCYCPDSFTLSKQHFCEYDDTCLGKICVGFKCENRKCLRNSVKCNGVDDCGDRSDEIGCERICHISEHLCEGECISKTKLCPTTSFEYNYPVSMDPTHHSKNKKDIYVVVTLLIILGILLVIFVQHKLCINRISTFTLVGVKNNIDRIHYDTSNHKLGLYDSD